MERFIKYFVPEKYVLDLKLEKDAKKIGGRVKVTGEALQETVKFHAVRLEVMRALVNGAEAKFKADGETLTVFEVLPGRVEIEIFYTGKLNENMQGAYLSTYEYEGRTETIIATQFESHYAREAFPCVDEPEAKAVFSLSLSGVEKGDTVLSNMPEKENNGDTCVFEETPRMSTYLLAFVVGKFHGKTVTNKHGVEITTYAALNQEIDSVDFANEVAARSLEFYDDNFGVPYPLKKLDQVALPDFEAGAMENWGLVTYRESMLLVSGAATLATRKTVALTVAHELSHQWFGDLVTMKWWDDLWLNESFASVMEYFAVDYAYPEFKIWEGFFTGDALSALKRDCLSGVQAVHQEVKDPEEIATLFDPAFVYSKGARLMLMTIRLMGWESFCKGIREYFEKYAYGNTVGDDLWAELSKHAEFDVKELMHGFIDRPGYPVIMGDEEFREYEQKRFLIDGEMTPSDWVLPEITEDMSGHYILNLSDAEFRRRLEDFGTLGLEEKLRLLIDRSLVVKTDLQTYKSMLELVMKFREETSAAVWSMILTIVSEMKMFFPYKSEEEAKYKKFVLELIRDKLAEVGLTTREGDDENTLRLRAILLALDFYAEDTANLEKLAGMYRREYGELDAEIRSDILDAKIYLEPEVIDEYLAAYEVTADPDVKFDLLLAGTLSRDEGVIRRMMKLLNRMDIVKPQDQFYLFIYLYRNPECRERVFSWLTENWGFVKEMSGDKSLDNYPRYTAGSVRTEEEFRRWKEFFRPMDGEPALKRAIEVGENEILARLKLIARDAEMMKGELERVVK